MAIYKPQLPPKSGYVEIEIDGKRKYKSITTGCIIDPYNTTPLPHEEINAMVVAKIREKYDINEEFKMINLGIVDPEDQSYIDYRTYVQECVDWGNNLEMESAGDD